MIKGFMYCIAEAGGELTNVLHKKLNKWLFMVALTQIPSLEIVAFS